MKKLYLILLFSIMLVGLVSAVNECGNDNSFLGKFKVNQTITLGQICDTCTYVNLSSVTYPNSTKIVYNTAMTKNGIEFNSSSTDTKALGCYSYSVYGDKDGTLQTETFDYLVTPTGLTNLANFYWIILAISAGLIILAFWIREGVFAMLGSFGLFFLSIYTIIYGIAGVRDQIVTWAIALILFGTAAYISIRAGFEMISD